MRACPGAYNKTHNSWQTARGSRRRRRVGGAPGGGGLPAATQQKLRPAGGGAWISGAQPSARRHRNGGWKRIHVGSREKGRGGRGTCSTPVPGCATRAAPRGNVRCQLGAGWEEAGCMPACSLQSWRGRANDAPPGAPVRMVVASQSLQAGAPPTSVPQARPPGGAPRRVPGGRLVARPGLRDSRGVSRAPQARPQPWPRP